MTIKFNVDQKIQAFLEYHLVPRESNPLICLSVDWLVLCGVKCIKSPVGMPGWYKSFYMFNS